MGWGREFFEIVEIGGMALYGRGWKLSDEIFMAISVISVICQ